MKQFRYELIVTLLYIIFTVQVIMLVGFKDLYTSLFTLTIVTSLPMIYLGSKTARKVYYEILRGNNEN